MTNWHLSRIVASHTSQVWLCQFARQSRTKRSLEYVTTMYDAADRVTTRMRDVNITSINIAEFDSDAHDLFVRPDKCIIRFDTRADCAVWSNRLTSDNSGVHIINQSTIWLDYPSGTVVAMSRETGAEQYRLSRMYHVQSFWWMDRIVVTRGKGRSARFVLMDTSTLRELVVTKPIHSTDFISAWPMGGGFVTSDADHQGIHRFDAEGELMWHSDHGDNYYPLFVLAEHDTVIVLIRDIEPTSRRQCVHAVELNPDSGKPDRIVSLPTGQAEWHSCNSGRSLVCTDGVLSVPALTFVPHTSRVLVQF